jgi:hypothetical protein
MKSWTALPLLALLLLSGACNYLPALPSNPFAVTPTVVAQATPEPAATIPPFATPSPSPVPFTAYWVKNFRTTEMWSGQSGDPGVISFGTTSAQFCSFQVVEPQGGPRLHVFNPYSKNYFWIDADAVGPVGEAPQPAPGPKPADQNCAEQIYDS